MSSLRNICTWFRRSHFIRNVLTVMTGTVAARVIGVACSPIISRLFSPFDFGLFGAFGTVSGVLAAGITLEYTQAIMLPKEKTDAMAMFVVSCLSTFAGGILCLLGCLLIPQAINGLMKTSGSWALPFLVMAVTISGINQACQAWCVRSKAFKNTSVSQVVRSVSSNGMQIGLGYFRGGAAGLIVGGILADVLASLTLVRVLLPDWKALRHSIRWRRMKELAVEHRDFPLYGATRNVLGSLSMGLPVLLLSHSYGLEVAGAYAFGMRILMLPMTLVLSALKQVLFQKACETHHDGGSLVSLFFKITGGLFAVALAPALALTLWAPRIFVWVFGSQWQLAGAFAQSLSLWLLFVFCNLPAILFARLIHMQRALFFFHLVMLIARALTLVVGGLYLRPVATIQWFSLVGAAMNIYLILMVGRGIMKNEGTLSLDQLRDCFLKR